MPNHSWNFFATKAQRAEHKQPLNIIIQDEAQPSIAENKRIALELLEQINQVRHFLHEEHASLAKAARSRAVCRRSSSIGILFGTSILAMAITAWKYWVNNEVFYNEVRHAKKFIAVNCSEYNFYLNKIENPNAGCNWLPNEFITKFECNSSLVDESHYSNYCASIGTNNQEFLFVMFGIILFIAIIIPCVIIFDPKYLSNKLADLSISFLPKENQDKIKLLLNENHLKIGQILPKLEEKRRDVLTYISETNPKNDSQQSHTLLAKVANEALINPLSYR